MTELVRIEGLKPLEDHWLRLWFTNGAVKDVDLSQALAARGVVEPVYTNRDLFGQVRVNPDTRTIEWPGTVDLDPDILYGTFELADRAPHGERASGCVNQPPRQARVAHARPHLERQKSP